MPEEKEFLPRYEVRRGVRQRDLERRGRGYPPRLRHARLHAYFRPTRGGAPREASKVVLISMSLGRLRQSISHGMRSDTKINASMRTIDWADGKIQIIDQTRLPEEEVWLSLSSVDELAEAISSLRVRGAPALGVAGGLGVALAARRARENGEDVGEAISP